MNPMPLVGRLQMEFFYKLVGQGKFMPLKCPYCMEPILSRPLSSCPKCNRQLHSSFHDKKDSIQVPLIKVNLEEKIEMEQQTIRRRARDWDNFIRSGIKGTYRAYGHIPDYFFFDGKQFRSNKTILRILGFILIALTIFYLTLKWWVR